MKQQSKGKKWHVTVTGIMSGLHSIQLRLQSICPRPGEEPWAEEWLQIAKQLESVARFARRAAKASVKSPYTPEAIKSALARSSDTGDSVADSFEKNLEYSEMLRCFRKEGNR